ncbi:hypothetical protein [Ferrovibrio sp.]|uniref:hypothetical protein n=1 Tax=Ferrovibrio sp. TaxID=1917215 RepID=UPI0035B20597
MHKTYKIVRKPFHLLGFIAAIALGWLACEQYQLYQYRRVAKAISGLDASKATFVISKSEWATGGPGSYHAFVFQFPAFDEATFIDKCNQIARHAIAFGAIEDSSGWAIEPELIPPPPRCGLSRRTDTTSSETATLGRDGRLYIEYSN